MIYWCMYTPLVRFAVLINFKDSLEQALYNPYLYVYARYVELNIFYWSYTEGLETS